MKIRMLQQMSGYRNGAPWPGVGEEMDVDAEEAATLTVGQTPIAEYVEETDTKMPPAEERATAAESEVPVETATATRTPPRPRSTTAKK